MRLLQFNNRVALSPCNRQVKPLGHRVGQAVSIEVDTLPRNPLSGWVESLGPASGVSYSSVAPRDATGNFTKVVQRLPVRIAIDPGQLAAGRFQVGMSVRLTIEVS